jgi:NAD(P)-dependent dehydrogenase (short-subunit alcohol dehydrogenase family)
MPNSAIVLGASGGIGTAFADLIENAGRHTNVHRLSRTGPATGPATCPTHVQIDLTDEPSLRRAADRLKLDISAPDLIVIASGILHAGEKRPERSMREIDGDWMVKNFRINAIGPALAAKHFIPLMPKTGRCVFAVLSARVGSISDNRLGGWYAYRASKAALNMIVRNLAIETQRQRPESIIVALHPGTVETALSAPFSAGRMPSGQQSARFTPQQSAAKLLAVLDGLAPSDSGQIFDYDGRLIAP